MKTNLRTMTQSIELSPIPSYTKQVFELMDLKSVNNPATIMWNKMEDNYCTFATYLDIGAKSGPAGLILVAKSGPPGPYLSAKNGPTLPKTVRFSSNEFVLNKTRKACPSNFSSLIAQLYNIWGTYTVVEAGALYMYMYVSV